jgi:hypothetical protein
MDIRASFQPQILRPKALVDLPTQRLAQTNVKRRRLLSTSFPKDIG